jgi:hypothetical protein
MTDDQAPQDWQSLLDIFYELGRLDHPLHGKLDGKLSLHGKLAPEGGLASREDEDWLRRAIRSRAVPILGSRDGLTEHIESKIDAETEINISLNEIALLKSYDAPEIKTANGEIYDPAHIDRLEIAVFKQVQADRASVEQWLREYVPGDNVDAECSKWLAGLPKEPRIKKEDARENFNEAQRKAKLKAIGVRPFSRMWAESAHPSWKTGGAPRKT